MPVKKNTQKLQAKKYSITIAYGYDIHRVQVSQKIMGQINNGEPMTVMGQGFSVEGTSMTDTWHFHGAGAHSLVVDGDDGFEIFIGDFADAVIDEIK